MEFHFEPVDDFNDFIQEVDKTIYPKASETINPVTGKVYIDADDDFLVGKSGGFLLNMNFKFINTTEFAKAGDYYSKHGTYIKDKVDSIPHKQFRLREEDRRTVGFVANAKMLNDGSVKSLRITGEHYNFLNYVEILRLELDSAEGNTGEKKKGFPRVFDSQYWWYKIKEFSRANGFNLLACKTRRAGFSYMEGKGSANSVNLIPDKNVLIAAWDKKYVTSNGGITDMALKQLEFYELNTPFKRGILSRNIENIRLGFKDKNKMDRGYLSGIMSVSTFNNADAAIGKDSNEIKVEERGTLPNFAEFMTQTEPTIKSGAYITGQVIAFGTVNSDSETADEFESDFRNPAGWRFMPFENVWDKNQRDSVCGFYKPFWWGLEGEIDGELAMDNDGNTNYDIAIRIAEREHKDAYDNADSLKKYIDFKGQYGNCPNDSFSSSFSNMFTSDELELHHKTLKNDPSYKFYRDGILEHTKDSKSGTVKFVSNERLLSDGRVQEIHPYITGLSPEPKGDNHGCLRTIFNPIKINGEVPDNLYRIWVDPFGVDKNKDEITRDNSFATAYVYMNEHNYTSARGDILVAVYIGRPEKQEDFSRFLLNLAIYYNAKILSENDRGQIIPDFRHWNKTKYLIREPSFAWDVKLQGSGGREFGVSMGAGSSNRKLAALGFLYEWLYTKISETDGVVKRVFHYIFDEPTINELIRFKLDGNFDRISALLVGMYDIKEMQYRLTKPKVKEAYDFTNDYRPVFQRGWY